ncbi:VapE domain-containing protein [Pontibacter populi]|uniref:VapE domain-containing protein n=1 Tax=Pontibacter populi TaxID=890055 RepID=A0ABV1RSN6_9BACT
MNDQTDDNNDIAQRYPSIEVNGLEITDYYYNGDDEEDSSSEIHSIEQFLSRNHEFRQNMVTGKLEFRKKGANTKFQPLTDRDENTFWRRMQKDKTLKDAKVTSFSLSYLRGILYSDFSKIYDPLKEYVESLIPWDQSTDYIAQLAQTVKTDNDELFVRLLRKWLVASVASLVNPEIVNQTALVFSGKQGIGKTSWILRLAPQQLKDYVFSGTINPNNKDTLIYLSSCFLINLDELENLNNSEVGALKEVITKPQIKMRRTYARNAEDLPRRASFAGSVNSSQFLNDTTGSRRFLCFEVFELDYNHTIDMDKVYAQAYALYMQGYQHWLSLEDIAELEASNRKFQKLTTEEELITEMFLPAKEGDRGCLLYSATQIAEYFASNINGYTINEATTQRIGRTLKKLGYQTYKKGGAQKYALKLKSTDTTNHADSIG